MNDISSSKNEEYFDLKNSQEYDEGNEELDEYFPAQSMFIENEWIRNSPGGLGTNNNTMMDELKEKKDNSSPYFENARIESEKVRFISPIQATKTTPSTPNINRSILNELLPTQMELNSSLIDNNYNSNNNNDMTTMTEEEFEKRYLLKDSIYGQIFKGSIIVWLVCTVLLMLTGENNPIQRSNYGPIFGWFACLVVLGLGLTAVWARILAEQTEVVVYGLMLIIPAGFGFLGLISMSHWYVFTGLFFLCISTVCASIIYSYKSTLNVTVEIVHNAAIFIQATPKVYPLVLKTIAIYVIFVSIWLRGFMGLFGKSNWSWLFCNTLRLFFVFILLWSEAVLATSQKFILATWVRRWMNQTDDSIENCENNPEGIINEKSFGSICLAAGLLMIGKIIRITTKSFQLISKSLNKYFPGGSIISQLLNWSVSAIFVIEKFMQRFTDFALFNLAINSDPDEGFIGSCKELRRVLDGHIKLAFTTDLIAQLLLSFSTVLISFSSTALIFYLAKSYITWSSGFLIGLLAASVTGFVSSTFTTAIDSMFLCYVLDLRKPEQAGRIKSEIKEAFSSKLSTV